MSDQYVDQHEDHDIPELRRAADEGRKAKAEAEALRRELAFTKAGVDVETPLGKMFAKSYDGKLDPDAVKEAWTEIAPATTPEAPSEPEPPKATEQQLEETAARRTLTAGGAGDVPKETPPADPVARGYEQFHERMQKGDQRAAAAGAVIGSLIQGAIEGDQRAIWTGWKPEDFGQ